MIVLLVLLFRLLLSSSSSFLLTNLSLLASCLLLLSCGVPKEGGQDMSDRRVVSRVSSALHGADGVRRRGLTCKQNGQRTCESKQKSRGSPPCGAWWVFPNKRKHDRRSRRNSFLLVFFSSSSPPPPLGVYWVALQAKEASAHARTHAQQGALACLQ